MGGGVGVLSSYLLLLFIAIFPYFRDSFGQCAYIVIRLIRVATCSCDTANLLT